MCCRQNRKKIMADYPSSSAKDASKILGDMWQKLSEKEHARYVHEWTSESYLKRIITEAHCLVATFQ